MGGPDAASSDEELGGGLFGAQARALRRMRALASAD
jgi:hypothetical protein